MTEPATATAPAPTPMYTIIVETDVNNNDVEPEVIKTVSSLDEAWAYAREDCRVAAEASRQDPEGGPHSPPPENYTTCNNMREAKERGLIGGGHVVFVQPPAVAAGRIAWAVAAGAYRLYVFGGAPEEYRAHLEAHGPWFAEDNVGLPPKPDAQK